MRKLSPYRCTQTDRPPALWIIPLAVSLLFIPAGQAYPQVAIDTLEALQAMEDDLDADYRLTADIDASQTVQWDGGRGFAPIGTETAPFTGTLDGDGHVISGLVIERPHMDLVGLFGVVAGPAARVHHVGLRGAQVAGKSAVGALVGALQNGAILEGCHTAGTISGEGFVGGLVGRSGVGTAVDDCLADGQVSASGDHAGGLVGFAEGASIGQSHGRAGVVGRDFVGGLVGRAFDTTITKSDSTGDVQGASQVGGLVGHVANGQVSRSSSGGTVTGSIQGAGGLIGVNVGRVNDCFSVSHVRGENSVGGFVGSNQGDIANSYSAGSVEGASLVGGFTGEHIAGAASICFWDTRMSGQATSSGPATGKATEQMMQPSTFAQWDFATVWRMFADASYPFFGDGIVTDLAADLTIDRPAAQMGDLLVYTATFANQGLLPALAAEITFTLPAAALTEAAYSLDDGAVWLDLPAHGRVAVGDIMAARAVTLMLRARVAVEGPATIRVEAHGTTTTVDRAPANDSAKAMSQITAVAPPAKTDLALTLATDQTSLIKGDTVKWRATLANQGTHPATAVVLALQPSVEAVTTIQYSLDHGGTWHRLDADGRLALSHLIAGESLTVHFTGLVALEGPAGLHLDLQVQSAVTDTDTANNSAVLTIPIEAEEPPDKPDELPVTDGSGSGGGGGCFMGHWRW